MSRLDRPTDLSTDLTDLMPAPPARRMSEEEFVAWCNEAVRAEWVDGEVILMSPASSRHVLLTVFLVRILGEFVEAHNLGQVLSTELVVRLPGLRRQRMPDLVFLSKERANLLQSSHLEGPPDTIMEIVSPDSVARDWREKYHEYEAAGVREYWIIDPMAERVEAYRLSGEGSTSGSRRARGGLPQPFWRASFCGRPGCGSSRCRRCARCSRRSECARKRPRGRSLSRLRRAV